MVDITEIPDDSHLERIQWLYANLREDDWDGEGSLGITEDAFYQAQSLLSMIEATFDEDVVGNFFVAPTSGGYFFEYMDPTDNRTDIRIPWSSFDTIISESGKITFWRSENLRWNGHQLVSDYEFDTSYDTPDADQAQVLELWLKHAKEFNDHLRCKRKGESTCHS